MNSVSVCNDVIMLFYTKEVIQYTLSLKEKKIKGKSYSIS